MTIEKITYRDPREEELDADGRLLGEDTRNVGDNYKHIPLEMIRSTLDEKRLPLVNVLFNRTTDFNKAAIVRASNAFLASEVYLIGKRRFDRRGTVGAHHTEDIYHCEEFAEVFSHLRQAGYTIFAVDNTPDFSPEVIYDTEVPLKSAFVYGEEQLGLDPSTVALCDHVVYIPQYGSVRSINVGQAAAVVMSEYSRRHRMWAE